MLLHAVLWDVAGTLHGHCGCMDGQMLLFAPSESTWGCLTHLGADSVAAALSESAAQSSSLTGLQQQFVWFPPLLSLPRQFYQLS